MMRRLLPGVANRDGILNLGTPHFDLVLADKQLNASGPILNVNKLELAFVAVKHNPTGSPNYRSVDGTFALFSFPIFEFFLGYF